MTTYLRLYVYNEHKATSTPYIDLIGYTSGIELAADGWIPRMIPLGEDTVVETLRLRFKNTSIDNIATNMQSIYLIAEYLEKRRRVNVDPNAVILAAQLGTETSKRYAVVHNITMEPATSIYGTLTIDKYAVQEVILTIERGHWSDAVNDDISNNSSGLTLIGGKYATDDVPGDAPCTLSGVMLTGDTGSGIAEIWGGIKDERYGDTSSYFEPTLNLRNGTMEIADTTGATSHADSEADDGYCVRTTFGTDTTMTDRVTYPLSLLGLSFENVECYRGLYRVLLRCKLSASGIATVRLKSGFIGDTDAMAYHGRVAIEYVSGTYFTYYDLGMVSIPSAGVLKSEVGYGGWINDFGFTLQVEQTSGTYNFFADCLVLIPLDAGSWHVSGANINAAVGGAYLLCNRYGETYAYGTDASTADLENITSYQLNSRGFVGNASVIIAGQRSTYSVKADKITFIIYAYRNWRMLRGADS